MPEYIVRKANLTDVPGIQRLIQHYAQRQFLLPRTLGQVTENLRDFFICEIDGEIVGCSALHLWSDLAEIRSLAVAEGAWRKGIGKKIVKACLDEACQLGARTVFVLTYQPEFFERMGFRRIGKDKFPQKIWVDCQSCPRFPNCNESALVIELKEASSSGVSEKT